jgi:hypothetical protein
LAGFDAGMMNSEPISSVPLTRRFGRRYLLADAGVGYVLAWLVGLAVWPANLSLTASDLRVQRANSAHAGQAVAQYLLVEGLAGVLLGVVLAGVATVRVPGRPAHYDRWIVIIGGAAVVVSIAHCVLGLLLVRDAVRGDVSASGDLFRLTNRLDGGKMWLLAGVSAYASADHHPAGWPAWLRGVGAALALALLASGAAYLFTAPSIEWSAYVSGPLLLVWVAAGGVLLTHRFAGSELENSTIEPSDIVGG